MDKEYIIQEIRASQDISPYVYITLRDPKNKTKESTTSGFKAVSFGSMDDMMENLGKVFNQQMAGGFTTVLKLTENEYRDLDVRVGDRVKLKIDKIELSSL
mgnify:CR=1 FL=1|jgi:hypothetical protein